MAPGRPAEVCRVILTALALALTSCGLLGEGDNKGAKGTGPKAQTAPGAPEGPVGSPLQPEVPATAVTAIRAVSYVDHIAPALADHCTMCHSGSPISPDLRSYPESLSAAEWDAFWTRTLARIVAGTMPPAGPLEASLIETFKIWQLLGYPFTAEEAASAAAAADPSALSTSGSACVQDSFDSKGVIPLSNDDLRRTLTDLFYTASLPSRYGFVSPRFSDFQNMQAALELVPEEKSPNGFSRGPNILGLNHIEAWASLAETVASGVVSNADIYEVLAGHAVEGATEGELMWDSCLPEAIWQFDNPNDQDVVETCVAGFLSEVGQAAYRRPLTASEVNRLMLVYQAGKGNIGSGASGLFEGVQLALEAILQSPHFVNRIELGTPAENGYALRSWELASKLAFTLWGRPPDHQLRQRAAENTLHDPLVLAGEVDRMLNVEKWVMEEFQWSTQSAPLTHFFKDRLGDFGSQWLNLDAVIDPTNHTDAFFGAGLAPFVRSQPAGMFRSDVTNEIRNVLEHVLVDERGGFRDLMTTRVTYHAPASILEGIYYPPEDPDVARTDDWSNCSAVPQNGRAIRPWCTAPVFGQVPEGRAGLLNRLAFLVQMQPDSVPVHRGAFVRQKLLCEKISLPSDIPLGELVPPPPDFSRPKRDRWHERTSPASCNACHRLINPIGFIMDHYDSIGRHIAHESLLTDGQWITVDKDTTGDPQIPGFAGQQVRSTTELSALLAQSEKANECFVSNWIDFSAQIGATESTECLVKDLNGVQSRESAGGMIQMVRKMVLMEAFRNRGAGDGGD